MGFNFKCLAQGLTKLMGWLGEKIAADPMVFFPFWLCFLLACSLPGFHQLVFVTDNERLFVPHSAIGLQVKLLGIQQKFTKIRQSVFTF